MDTGSHPGRVRIGSQIYRVALLTARVDPCAAHGIDTLPAIMRSTLLRSKLWRPRMDNNANPERQRILTVSWSVTGGLSRIFVPDGLED
jgi:hypothetical protein